jgi:hypothetical protein
MYISAGMFNSDKAGDVGERRSQLIGERMPYEPKYKATSNFSNEKIKFWGAKLSMSVVLRVVSKTK